MKKIVSLFMGALIAVSTSISTFGAVGTIYNGKTMVPVRGVFEELGFTVTWDSASATAVISDSNYTIQVPKGKTYFMVNGQSIKPDVPQQVINGSLYLPLRAIGDSVGAATSWDSGNKMAHINYNGKDSYVKCGNASNSSKSTSTNTSTSTAATPSTSTATYSPITGVRYSLYNDTMSYVRSSCYMISTDILSFDAETFNNRMKQFKTQCLDQTEELFVSSCALAVLSYGKLMLYFEYSEAVAIENGTYYLIMNALEEGKDTVDEGMSAFINFKGSAAELSVLAIGLSDAAENVQIDN